VGEPSFIALIQGGSTGLGRRLEGVIVSGWADRRRVCERRVPVGGGNDGLAAVRSVTAAVWLVQARSVWPRLAKAQELQEAKSESGPTGNGQEVDR
jgi:hypothetical protein